MIIRKWGFALAVMLSIMGAPAVHAQFAVIDVGAIAQLISQAQTLENQLATAHEHLAVAQAELGSITGARAMERLVAGAPRNYLPADWSSLRGVMQGNANAYGSLSGELQGDVGAISVLTPAQLSTLAPDVQNEIESDRRVTALLQSASREALAITSGRFPALQQLISVLPAAGDQKAVLDLQARIGAENVMLQNEQTKLQTLYQVIQAEERAGELQRRERAISGHGAFVSRFQPIP
jgi:type IV secretion system protein VirB5